MCKHTWLIKLILTFWCHSGSVPSGLLRFSNCKGLNPHRIEIKPWIVLLWCNPRCRRGLHFLASYLVKEIISCYCCSVFVFLTQKQFSIFLPELVSGIKTSYWLFSSAVLLPQMYLIVFEPEWIGVTSRCFIQASKINTKRKQQWFKISTTTIAHLICLSNEC